MIAVFVRPVRLRGTLSAWCGVFAPIRNAGPEGTDSRHHLEFKMARLGAHNYTVRHKMHRSLYLIFSLLFSIALSKAEEPQNLSITFFPLHEDEAPGTKRFRSKSLELDAFVSAKPALEIRLVKDVYKWTQEIPTTTYARDGSVEKEEVVKHPCVLLELREEDAITFANLTEEIIGQRLLIKIGGKPHSAPVIASKIESGSMFLRCKSKKAQESLLKALEGLRE